MKKRHGMRADLKRKPRKKRKQHKFKPRKFWTKAEIERDFKRALAFCAKHRAKLESEIRKVDILVEAFTEMVQKEIAEKDRK